jgi:hypothetical protein
MMDETAPVPAAAHPYDAPDGPDGSKESAPAGSVGAGGPPAAKIDNFVERWWREHFHGSAVAQHVLAWNVAHDAKEDLKVRLATLVDAKDEAPKA